MSTTLAAAGDYDDIGVSKTVKVCCNGNSTISVRAIPTVPTPTDVTTPITTQTPIIVNATLSIDRKCRY